MFLNKNISMYDNKVDWLWTTVNISTIMWVFEDICVIYAKTPFLHSFDVLIKMFLLTRLDVLQHW